MTARTHQTRMPAKTETPVFAMRYRFTCDSISTQTDGNEPGGYCGTGAATARE